MGNPGVRLLVPSARLRDVRPMGDEDKHARFRLESGSQSALGVAFGVNGDLAADRLTEPVDVSLELELNEWQGAVSPRVVLGELYPGAAEGAPRRDLPAGRLRVGGSTRRRAAGAAGRVAAAGIQRGRR